MKNSVSELIYICIIGKLIIDIIDSKIIVHFLI